MRIRTTISTLAAAAALGATAAPAVASPPSSDTPVCNEAENSFRGGYEVSGGQVDANPPAFLRGSQMRIGAGAGVLNAADHSPALRECGAVTGDGGGADGSGGGADDGGDPVAY